MSVKKQTKKANRSKGLSKPRSRENPTVVFPKPGKVVLENRPRPRPQAGEVIVQSHCSLISTGTELTMLSRNFPNGSYWDNYVKYPVLPGYCNVGTVVEAGPGVDRKWLGRRVASLGNHARYVKARVCKDSTDATFDPWQWVRPILRDVPDEQAAFFTIGEIVMNGVRRANVRWGESVVVYGLGLLGQLTVQFCRLAGARPIIGVDVSPSRLACLPKDPAVKGVNPRTSDVVAEVEKATRGAKADVVFEVTGAPDLIPQEFAALRSQGRFVVLSSPTGKTSFDFNDLCNAPSYTIIGSHNFSHPLHPTLDNPWTNLRDGELFFDYLADGALQVEPLISHRASYTEASALYESLVQDRSAAMGVVLDWTA